jgi:hypothetical protein
VGRGHALSVPRRNSNQSLPRGFGPLPEADPSTGSG